ncbi:alpha/beta hydrolase [Halomontanus rarus]|uniref:alpha/beta hydrolase n=1 Tax=Halomontanus rarus TaxID=3034020 RepID=UPI0023E89828|nr:alpha/beta hydrolase [Halovivax sp. TS33]
MPDVTSTKGVVYRQTAARDLRLDLHLPAGGDDRPAVIFIHGGGWEANHRGMFEAHLTRLAARGYVGVDLTHRLSSDATFPTPVEDVAYGVRWLKAHADEYGIDPDRVAIGGHSSGAHLAALTAVAPDLSELAPDRDTVPDDVAATSSRVAAAVLLNGPYNLERLGQFDPAHLFISGFVRRLFGGEYLDRPAAYRLASCPEHVDGSEPPALVMTSTNDEEVPFRESVQFRKRLERVGGTADLVVADGGDHLCFTGNGSHYEWGMDRIETFLDAHL